MVTHSADNWDNRFLVKHPIFWPLMPSAQEFVESHQNWPSLSQYQRYFDSGAAKRISAAGAPLIFVEQDHKPDTFEKAYEPRIYLKGEIQTRQHNWHDFFQVLVWRAFSKSKSVINHLHFNALKQREDTTTSQHTRGPIENALTQFDECGAVILSSEPQLLQLIENFQWQELFWQRRNDLFRKLKCIVFGHALYEKALNPYIGMTAHSLLFTVDPDFIAQPTHQLISETDDLLSNCFTQNTAIQSPQDFSPFPLLGMPDWHPENGAAAFYENQQYFRPGRRRKN